MLLSAEELEKSAVMDPEIRAFIKANPRPPADWENVQFMRARMNVVEQQMQTPVDGTVIEEYRAITMRDGFVSTIKIHKPAKPPKTGSPLIVSFFGGGWVVGSIEAQTPSARAYVGLFGATVVAPSYRLAPEYKFPIGQNDAWDSVEWLVENAIVIGADPTQGFIVEGVSAGATNAAAVVAHAIANPLKHSVTGQYLCVPSLMDEKSVPEEFRPYFLSREHNRNAPVLHIEALKAMEKHTAWDENSPWRYPVLTKAPLSKQPRAYLQADGMDPLRDDALIWDEMLREAGVQTRLDFYPGCPHAHCAFMPDLKISKRAVADQMVGVGWLLGRGVTVTQHGRYGAIKSRRMKG